MKTILLIFKSIIALVYLSFTVTIAIILFMDMDKLGKKIFKKMDYKVIGKIHGGEITDVINNKKYITRIHKMVFDGVFKERNEGFIQIDWFSNELLPNHITEKVDYNKDGIIDFKIDLYAKENKAVLTTKDDKILNIMDKTSMGSLIMKGYDDGRYNVFIYHNYEEATFLDYSFEELQSIDAIKSLVTPQYIGSFNEYLSQINNNNSIIIEMISKSNIIEKIKISYDTVINDGELLNRIIFELISNKKREQLVLVSEIDDIFDVEYITLKTIYKDGRSVRVIVKK